MLKLVNWAWVIAFTIEVTVNVNFSILLYKKHHAYKSFEDNILKIIEIYDLFMLNQKIVCRLFCLFPVLFLALLC